MGERKRCRREASVQVVNATNEALAEFYGGIQTTQPNTVVQIGAHIPCSIGAHSFTHCLESSTGADECSLV